METPLQPCPFCGAPGSLVDDGHGLHFVECSNLVDCSEWPMTHGLAWPEEAAVAWNAGLFRRPALASSKS